MRELRESSASCSRAGFDVYWLLLFGLSSHCSSPARLIFLTSILMGKPTPVLFWNLIWAIGTCGVFWRRESFGWRERSLLKNRIGLGMHSCTSSSEWASLF